MSESITYTDRATDYVVKNRFKMQDTFRVWGMFIMDRVGIGGMRFGDMWLKDPATWGNYSWFINTILPQSPEDMLLFCECKFRVEVFLLAKLDRYDVIKKIIDKGDKLK